MLPQENSRDWGTPEGVGKFPPHVVKDVPVVVEKHPWICGVCVGLDIRKALLVPEVLTLEDGRVQVVDTVTKPVHDILDFDTLHPVLRQISLKTYAGYISSWGRRFK